MGGGRTTSDRIEWNEAIGGEREEEGRVERVRLSRKGGGRLRLRDARKDGGRRAAGGRRGSFMASFRRARLGDGGEDGGEERVDDTLLSQRNMGV